MCSGITLRRYTVKSRATPSHLKQDPSLEARRVTSLCVLPEVTCAYEGLQEYGLNFPS